MEETEYLLPSEIARLVYGQLMRMNCNKIAEEFLNTSPHMKECVEPKKKNRSFSTRAHNRTLDEIFNEFINVNELLLNTVNDETLNVGRKFYDPVEALKFIIAEIESSDVDANIRFTHFRKESSKSVTSDEETFSDICLDIRSSPDLVNARISHQSSLLNSLYNSNNNMEKNNGFKSNPENNNSAAVSNHRNDVSHESSSKSTTATTRKKVKILPPRITVPVIGKKISDSENDNYSIEKGSKHCEDSNSHNSALPCLEMDCTSSSQLVSESPENAPPTISEPAKSVTLYFDDDHTPTKQTSSTSITAVVGGKSTRNSKPYKKKNSMTPPRDNCKSNPRRTSFTDENVESPVDTINLIQKLVEHNEFSERLARNINVARNESPHNKSASEELDCTITKIASETINDPLCKNIISEMLGIVDEDNALQDNANEVTNKNGETFILEDSNEVDSRTYGRNSSYQEMQQFVTFNNEEPINVPIEGEMTSTERDYVIHDEINVAYSNSAPTNVQTLVVWDESVAPLDNIGDNSSYVINQNFPLITCSKETKRRKFQPLRTLQTKKPVPIAPKPTTEVEAEQERSQSQLGSNTSKRTKK